MNAVDNHRLNPFPGLRPFRSDEHHLFFGREEQTAALLQLLRTNRFLAVVGTSGSGKSSLVRAGLIAGLHGGTMTQAGSSWEVMILRPGGNPIENLARAFFDADLYDAADPNAMPRLLATLSRSRFGLVEAIKQSEVFEAGVNLLVVVDQFEELFRFRQQGLDSEESAAAFVNLLLTASEQAECPIYVAITMRSDYLGDCSEIPGLAEAVNEGEYLIPRLLRDQKRDAIEKPIGVGGAKISPLLVQRLLNEVGDDPDQLPVLQHALMRMWDVWSARGEPDRPIDFADFEATGGLAAALSNHADEIHDVLPDDRHRSVCATIFKTLTEKGADNRGIRRPTRLTYLQAIAGSDRATVTTVLDAFRRSGVTFLMPGTESELTDKTVVDLSHESLMRGWQRLRGWVEDEAQSARIFRRLLDTARLWSDGKAGMFRDPDLQIALSWREQASPNTEWADQYGGGLDTAIGFLEASNSEAQADRQAKEAARQRELKQARELAEARQLQLEQQQRAAGRLRTMIGGLAVVALVAGVACVVALVARNEAVGARNDADTERAKAREEEIRAVAEAKNALVARNEADAERKKARDEEIRAVAEAKNATLQQQKAEAATQRADRQLLLAETAKYAMQLKLADISSLDFNASPAQSLLKEINPKLRNWEYDHVKNKVDSRQKSFGDQHAYFAVAISADGKLVAGGGKSGAVELYDFDTGQLLAEFKGPWSAVRSLAFSPGGRLLAGASDISSHVWDVESRKQLGKVDLKPGPPPVNPGPWAESGRRVAFDAEGKRLALGLDDEIQIWDATLAKMLLKIDSGNGYISSIAFDPKRNRIAARRCERSKGFAEGMAPKSPEFVTIVFDAATGDLVFQEKLDTGNPPGTLCYDPRGRWLLTTNSHRGFDVRQPETGQPLDSPLKQVIVESNWPMGMGGACLNGDGSVVAITSSFEGHVELLDTKTGKSLRKFRLPSQGLPAFAQDIALSPDGTRFVAATGTDFGGKGKSGHGKLLGYVIAEDATWLDLNAMAPGNAYTQALAICEKAGWIARAVTITQSSVPREHNGDELKENEFHAVQFHSLKTGEILFSLRRRDRQFGNIVASSDGETLLANANGVIEVWDLKTRRIAREIRATDADATLALTNRGPSPLGAEDTHIASIESRTTGKQRTHRLILWDVKTGAAVWQTDSTDGILDTFGFSPDGSRLLVDFQPKREPPQRDPKTGKRIIKHDPKTGLPIIEFKSVLKVFDARTGKVIVTSSDIPMIIFQARFRSADEIFYTGVGGFGVLGLTHWNTVTGATVEISKTIGEFEICRDGSRLIGIDTAQNQFKLLRVLDMGTMQEVYQTPNPTAGNLGIFSGSRFVATPSGRTVVVTASNYPVNNTWLLHLAPR